jgi:hypothetical protein
MYRGTLVNWRVIGEPELSIFITAYRPTRVSSFSRLDLILGGDKRPIFLDGIIWATPVIAQVGETLYYFSAGFLTFKQSDFTSCLSADRRLPRLQCRVAARVRLMTASDTWNPALRC